MPWCSACDAFLSPPSVRVDGSCPRCGAPVEPGHAHVAAEAPDDEHAAETTRLEDPEEPGPVPWHLKLLAGGVTVYLGYRAWQGIEWLARRM